MKMISLKLFAHSRESSKNHLERSHAVRPAVADASSSNEAVHLQQRLRSLNTKLVILRNRLHVNQPPNNSGPNSGAPAPLSKSPEKGGVPSSPAPAVPPRTTIPLAGTLPHGLAHPSGHTLTASAIVHPHVNHAGANTLGHNPTAANNLISGQYAAVHVVHAFVLGPRVVDAAWRFYREMGGTGWF